MNHLKNRDYYLVIFLSWVLMVLFTLTIAHTLFIDNQFFDVVVLTVGLILFLIQVILAISYLKKQYGGKEIPILNPWVLKCRTKYGMLPFILLPDFINLRLAAIVLVLMCCYSHLFDASWWLYFASLVLLFFIKIYVGIMTWHRYGEYLMIENSTL
jgi:hypothetical protein